MRITAGAVAVAAWALALPGLANAADASWTCSASGGWVAASGQRADAAAVGGDPCASASSSVLGAAGPAGSLTASGTVATDAGQAAQTTDARQTKAAVSAQSLAIRSANGKLVLTASGLSSNAAAACDANRQPVLTTSGSPGTVILNGHTVDTSSDYSEPGTGVNGAPLLGRILIHFNEVGRGDGTLTRRAIHLIVTDSSGVVVFEAAAGEAGVGYHGDVCAPPPVCPPGEQPQQGQCVKVTATVPPPPPPVSTLPAPLPAPGGPPSRPGRPRGPQARRGCPYADARAGQAAPRRLAKATLCLLNVQRRKHHLSKLRLSSDLSRAALRHARSMVRQRYFSHTEPGGAGVVQRILQSGYLSRYGSWRIGENLGWGWGGGATPRSIVTAWMRSAPHRHNILSRSFRDVGIAVVDGSPRNRRSGSITYVIDFGGFRLATRAR